MSFLYIKLTQIYILACLFSIFLYSTRMQYSYMPFFCAAVRTILANACLNLLEDDQGAVFFLFIVSNLECSQFCIHILMKVGRALSYCKAR